MKYSSWTDLLYFAVIIVAGRLDPKFLCWTTEKKESANLCRNFKMIERHSLVIKPFNYSYNSIFFVNREGEILVGD